MSDSSEAFLASDFNQCFEQMRYYDSQIVGILKFQFTAYTTLIGVAIGMIKYGESKQLDFSYPVSAFLFVGLLIGLLLYFIVIRNRVYFVHTTRYVNEVRLKYLAHKPLGIENESGMYVNCNFPKFFNFWSSQAFHLYIVAVFNSTLAYMILLVNSGKTLAWWGLFIILIIQLVTGIRYLMSKENKTADQSVFGVKKK